MDRHRLVLGTSKQHRTRRCHRARAVALAVIWSLTAAGGCHLIFPFTPMDHDGPSDARPQDGLPVPDIAAAEGSIKKDQGKTPDRGPPDAWSPPPACGSNSAAASAYGPTMKICYQATSSVNHCDAYKLCDSKAGWSQCTATQFLARGGMSTPVSTSAWLRSCVFNGGAAMKPTDSLCSNCKGVSSTTIFPLAWQAKMATYWTSYLQIGLRSWTTKQTVGTNVPANEAYWHPLGAHYTLTAAVCCYK